VRQRIFSAVFALGAGFVFGTGLWVSGMANPRKVLGFLDVAGNWDPSLMLVMGGALAVTLPGFRAVLKRSVPLFDKRFYVPASNSIDLPLVAGSALFGLGWGIGGYCPGPALTALATLSTESVVFVASMVVGGALHRLVAGAPR
jgi:uncharacterized membrane protein YedE/YeeE